MTKTYAIPKVIASHEVFYYNNGLGKLVCDFAGGINDPKIEKPATYTTANEFEQIVIETSPVFGLKIFLYDNGQFLSKLDQLATTNLTKAEKKTKKVVATTKTETAPVASTSSSSDIRKYENVVTLGQASEVLLGLGAKAADVADETGIISTMLKMRVAFPNLDTKA